MAESAVKLLIQNLIPLLAQEVTLLEGIHDKVADINGELESIQSFLKDADARAEMGDMSAVAKTWVKQVREKSYNVEDVIDEYIFHLAKHPQRQWRHFRFLHKAFHFTINLKLRHVISSKIQGINNDLKLIRERGERYGFNFLEQGGPSNDVRHDTWHDPRVASLFLEEAEVVGIESPKAELINWLVEGPFNRMVISVVGIGGLGKTTLVKKVYENEKVVAHFDCCVWITVSQSYKMEELLRHMIKQFYQASEESASTSIESIDTMKEIELIGEVRQFVLERRYVVVFDDIWNIRFWGYIKHALPDNGKGSRIIITTRSESVAPSNKESPSNHVYKLSPLPLEKAYELFCKKVFQCESRGCPLELVELSLLIIERCEGLPLALEVIGGLLSTKEKSAFEWRKFLNSLSSELQSNPHLLSITKILSLSYFDLPYNLKACFLYLGMFLEDYFINCARLIRLWIAEGFIKEKQGITLEDVAQEYLKQLIHRSLIQVEHVNFIGRIRTCRVHDMMREVILSRSEDLGFHLVSIQNYSSFDRIARRLSIRNNVDTPLKCITSSKTRSILILRVDQVPNAFLTTCFVNFKLMKIMDFEGAPINHIPKEVGNLFHLRYLSLRDTKVQVLPKSIGKLQNLETLDLKCSLVYKLPMEINGLCKLRYLVAYIGNNNIDVSFGSRRPVKIQSGIGYLESLEKLYNVEADCAALVEELGRLTQLRKLEISKLKREHGMSLCTALEKMSYLRSLRLSSTSEEENLELQSMSSLPSLLQILSLKGRLEKLPECIVKLKNIVKIRLQWSRLMDDPLNILQLLPNLMELRLYEGYEGEQLHFKEGGFQKLKLLGLRNLRGLNSLIIDKGALPLLEKLRIGSSPMLNEVPFGIYHLKGLKTLEFFDMQNEFVLSMQPKEGHDFWKVEHVSVVIFWYRIQGEQYKTYKLGDSKLLELLQG